MLELESGIDLDMKIGSLDEFCMLSIPIEKWHAGSSLNFGNTLIIQYWPPKSLPNSNTNNIIGINNFKPKIVLRM